MPKSFGQERYYSERNPLSYPEAHSDKADEAYGFFKDALGARRRKKEEKSARERVETAVERWSSRTREKVRTEMKFKFNYDGAQESVPVRVEDRVPPPFVELFKQHSDPLIWRLLLERSKLETTAKGLRLVGKNFRRMERSFEDMVPSDTEKSDVMSSRRLVEALLSMLEDSSVLESFGSIRGDVLGAYFFRVPEIQIYWLPIAVTAKALDISLEALTVVVLLHERAHAYTHKGFDVDGAQWPTPDFARADLSVVEGLAQYYTWAVCRKMEEEYPTWIGAFDRLLKFQPDPYREHSRWNPDGERAGEAIRGAMNSARAQPIYNADRFEEMVEQVRGQLSE